jgi:hypothetical protein
MALIEEMFKGNLATGLAVGSGPCCSGRRSGLSSGEFTPMKAG